MIDVTKLQFNALDFLGLRTLVSWAEAEGWNPGVNDAEVFWATDPGGFIGCFYDEEMIAGGSIVSYNGDFGFMGFFIVKPQYRASGIGRRFWHHRRDMLLSRLRPGASIGMDGVVAMQPFYARGGFNVAFRDERYERPGAQFEIDSRVTSIEGGDMPAILLYDEQCFGFPRPQFMKPWLFQFGASSFKFTEQGEVKGFALLRKAMNGYKIGPLFADTVTVAGELYKACLNAAPGDSVSIDIPMVNFDAVALVRQFGAEYVFECARMYYGHPPDIAVDKIYGITSFELG